MNARTRTRSRSWVIPFDEFPNSRHNSNQKTFNLLFESCTMSMDMDITHWTDWMDYIVSVLGLPDVSGNRVVVVTPHIKTLLIFNEFRRQCASIRTEQKAHCTRCSWCSIMYNNNWSHIHIAVVWLSSFTRDVKECLLNLTSTCAGPRTLMKLHQNISYRNRYKRSWDQIPDQFVY